ncbi:MAG: hypothetical protein U0165_02950 [Polyangiaceae bacterium]
MKALAPVYYGGMLAMMLWLIYACWHLKNVWVVQALIVDRRHRRQ